MLTTTPPLDAAAESNAAQPEFATLQTATRICGLGRSSLYELEKAKKIRFARVRMKGTKQGRVLVDLASVRAHLAKCMEAA